ARLEKASQRYSFYQEGENKHKKKCHRPQKKAKTSPKHPFRKVQVSNPSNHYSIGATPFNPPHQVVPPIASEPPTLHPKSMSPTSILRL
ncbi:MAG: hypothetical protein K2I99_04040, partial [Bacteroidaceae bacterium]|nr:hypothetical protein [Bacteroidaceae bacterium]